MASSSFAPSQRRSPPLTRIPWLWVITAGYLSIMLFLPTTALLTTAISVGAGEFWAIATSPIALSAYEVTFITAIGAATLNGIFGTLAAWVLVRYEFPGKRIIDAAVDIPFALPTSVAGLALATVYNDTGWIGSLFAPFNIQLVYSRIGVSLAMLLISLPFVVRTVQPVLTEMEKDVEEAAWSLGASRLQTFWHVVLPSLMPGILTGVALGFSRAVGEYGSTVMVASNIPKRDLIAPVLVFQQLEQYKYAEATVIGAVLLLISLVLLFLINLLQAWGRRYEHR